MCEWITLFRQALMAVIGLGQAYLVVVVPVLLVAPGQLHALAVTTSLPYVLEQLAEYGPLGTATAVLDAIVVLFAVFVILRALLELPPRLLGRLGSVEFRVGGFLAAFAWMVLVEVLQAGIVWATVTGFGLGIVVLTAGAVVFSVIWVQKAKSFAVENGPGAIVIVVMLGTCELAILNFVARGSIPMTLIAYGLLIILSIHVLAFGFERPGTLRP